LTHAIRSRRALARILIILAALSATAGVAATTTALPARAAPPFPGDAICFVVFRNGVPVGTRCVWVPDFTPKPEPQPCPVCSAIVFDFGGSLPVDRQVRANGLIGDGIGLLVQADLATDPADSARYEAAALERFAAAAREVGDAPVAVRDTGSYDTRDGTFVSKPTAWLDAAGVDLARGLMVLASDPDGDPVVRFDEAYKELSHRTPIGD
jgi:hypothetical protein